MLASSFYRLLQRLAFGCWVAIVSITPVYAQSDPLPSWNDTAAKQAIVAFVGKVTREGTPDFVPVPERIATFDNDGTLWAEQPLYFQLLFAFDRVKELAPQHPEWQSQEPFASLLKGDVKAALAGGERAAGEIVVATHSGMTTTEFSKLVTDWLATARHPVTKRPYTEMVYQPMLELMIYLRANGFKTFIVSGGGIDFMRPWAEKVYGIPPEQVVGSSGKTQFEMREGKAVLMRLPEISFIDDKAGKPVGNPAAYRAAPDRCLRQLGRRSPDAAMDHLGTGPGLRPDRAPHRPGAGMGLRSHVVHRDARQGAGRRRRERLDSRRHEERLEDDLPIRQQVIPGRNLYRLGREHA